MSDSNTYREPWPHHGGRRLTEAEAIDRFWRRTRPNGACVVWTGPVTPKGYGRVSWQRRDVYAHRLAFFLRMGRWPEGSLRHLCNNPPCVLHVVEGTQSENERDKFAAGTHPSLRITHCPQGHPYDEANTYRPPALPNVRQCIACRLARDANRSGGRSRRVGESHHWSKLTDQQVRDIRSALDDGERQAAIAKRFGVSQSHVSLLKRRLSRAGS